MTEIESLKAGSLGQPVRDLQARLVRLGLDVAVSGEFDEQTERAVREFQMSRSLRANGVCERDTWSALIEAGYRLGDRLLYQKRPMLRGDDVTTLQQRLNALGFDAGREDGIFGPATERALKDFQMNAGLASDGVLGPESCNTLERMGSLAAGSVASVREREFLRSRQRSFAGARVFIAAEPGLDALADAVAHGLGVAGAHTLVDHSGREDAEVAASANEFGADVFFAIRSAQHDEARCAYFANQTFRSEGGFAIACRVDSALAPHLGPAPPPEGRTYSLLRDTTMAAVVLQPVVAGDVDGMRNLVSNAGTIASVVVEAIRDGFEEPFVDS